MNSRGRKSSNSHTTNFVNKISDRLSASVLFYQLSEFKLNLVLVHL